MTASMNVITMNVTTSALSLFGDFSGIGWLTTALVFLAMVSILFILFRNFKRIVWGSLFSGVTLILFKISRWVGVSTQEKNYFPLKWFVYIIGFILLSWFFGYLMEKFKLINKIQNKLKVLI